MTGLRERKRQRTFTAIHDAAMRLFAARGYDAVTVAEIADAAGVSRATVFAYYPAKEEIVLGQAPAAVDELVVALGDAVDRDAVIATVRGWLGTLAGWVEPGLVLQTRLAAEVPAVGAARSRIRDRIEQAIADALARTMGAGHALAARLAAGSLAAALATVEQEAVRRMESTGGALEPAEVDRLLDDAIAFVHGGLARIGKSPGRTAG